MPIEISWKRSLGLSKQEEVYHHVHDLYFEGEGNAKTITVMFDGDAFKNAMSQEADAAFATKKGTTKGQPQETAKGGDKAKPKGEKGMRRRGGGYTLE